MRLVRAACRLTRVADAEGRRLRDGWMWQGEEVLRRGRKYEEEGRRGFAVSHERELLLLFLRE